MIRTRAGRKFPREDALFTGAKAKGEIATVMQECGGESERGEWGGGRVEWRGLAGSQLSNHGS